MRGKTIRIVNVSLQTEMNAIDEKKRKKKRDKAKTPRKCYIPNPWKLMCVTSTFNSQQKVKEHRNFVPFRVSLPV